MALKKKKKKTNRTSENADAESKLALDPIKLFFFFKKDFQLSNWLLV